MNSYVSAFEWILIVSSGGRKMRTVGVSEVSIFSVMKAAGVLTVMKKS